MTLTSIQVTHSEYVLGHRLVLEGLLKATESKLAAAVANASRSASGGSSADGGDAGLLRRAEAEKARLLAMLTEERLGKRKAEDEESASPSEKKVKLDDEVVS